MTPKEWDILEAVAYCDGVWDCGYTMFFKGLRITKPEFMSVKKKYYERTN